MCVVEDQDRLESRKAAGQSRKQWLTIYGASLGTCLHQVYVRMTDREHNDMMDSSQEVMELT